MIDLGNYWASTDHQNIKWRAGLDPMRVEYDRLVNFLAYSKRAGVRIDYVLLWTGGFPHVDLEDKAIRSQLHDYQLIYTSPADHCLELYRRTVGT